MDVHAFFCDAATVREGLLNVLGAGVTRLARAEFPCPIGATVALLLEVHPTEMGQSHGLRVLIQREDGQTVAQADAEFEVEGGSSRPGEILAVPLVVPLDQAQLPEPGGYSIEILVDNQHKASWAFFAMLPSEAQQGD